jgi:hypothetical protein
MKKLSLLSLLAVLSLTAACGSDHIVTAPPTKTYPQDFTRNPNVGFPVAHQAAVVPQAPVARVASVQAATASSLSGLMNLVSNDGVVIGPIVGFYGPTGMAGVIVNEQVGDTRYLTLRSVHTGEMGPGEVYYTSTDCTGTVTYTSSGYPGFGINAAEAPFQEAGRAWLVEHPYADVLRGTDLGLNSMSFFGVCKTFTADEQASYALGAYFPVTNIGPVTTYMAPLKFVAQQ